MKNPTITDIARLASVSVGTASNVINGKPVVSQARVDRVLAAARDLNYNRNALAASLRLKQTGVVAFLVPTVENAFFSEVLQEIEHCALEDGRSVLFLTTGEDEKRTRKQLQTVISRRVDGLIIIPSFDYLPALIELDRYDIPIVVVDRVGEESPFPSVTSDNKGAGVLAGNHLFEQGVQDVVYFGHSEGEFWILEQRELGFRESANNFGRLSDVRFVDLSLDVTVGVGQAKAFFESLDRTPAAIFASSNLAAKSVIPAMQALGWTVPDDTKLLVMDDFEALSIFQPGISVISQPTKEIARRAWAMLMQELDGNLLENDQVVLDSALIIRGSTSNNPAGRPVGRGRK